MMVVIVVNVFCDTSIQYFGRLLDVERDRETATELASDLVGIVGLNESALDELVGEIDADELDETRHADKSVDLATKLCVEAEYLDAKFAVDNLC